MTKTRPFAELKAKVMADPESRAAVAAYKRAMEDVLALSQLREQRNDERQEQKQGQVGEDGTEPVAISRIEHEEDLYLATLRGFAAALGGHLEVSIVFPDGKVMLVPTAG